MTAGNHSLICITEKLYRKISFSVSGLSKRFLDRYLESAKKMSADSEKERKKIIRPKPSSRDGNMLKYHVRAQPSSTEAATLSSPDSDDDQTRPNCLMNTLIQLFAFCYEPGVTRKKWKGNHQQALKVFTVCVDNKK